MSAHDDRIPWVTWLSAGAAILVLCATVFVLLSPAAGPPSAAAAAGTPEASPEVSAQARADARTQSAPKGRARHPLDISPALMDARVRAGRKLEGAALVGVRLIIDGGRPLGPIEITYAAVRGRPLPGDPVTPKRLHVSYDGGEFKTDEHGQLVAMETEETDRSPARVLPDPNCPLEAAFRAVTQAGAPEAARTFAVYAHSVRSKRPVWTLTAADGAVHHVDADNCALLVR